MTELKDWAAKVLAEAHVLKVLTVAHRTSRQKLEDQIADVGDRVVGKIGDDRIGTVTLQEGREYVTVSDPEAFLDWVAVFRPDEIIQAVRSSYTDAVLEEVKKRGGLVDPGTGEVTVPPGITRRKAPPSLYVRPDRDVDVVVKAWLGEAAEQLGITS